MSSKRVAPQTVALDLFLSGKSGVVVGEKDQPIIVVDTTRRRPFAGHGVSSDRTKSFSNSGASFCSSVTSCSLGSTPSNTALRASRWESMPRSRKAANQDTILRVPRRNQGLSLRRPSRTRTNDLLKKKSVSPTTSKKSQKRSSVIASPSSSRRITALRCDSAGSSRREIKA